MSKNKAQELLEKYLNGTCTDAERAQFESWYTQAANEREDLPGQPDYAKLQAQLIANLPKAPKTILHLPYRKAYAAAALFIATLATTLYFYTQYKHQKPILPGGNRATLTLSDGTKVELDSAQRGIIVNDEDIKYQNGESVSGRHPSLSRQVGRIDPGSLSAKTSPKSGEMLNQVQHDALLQLSTPKGGQYQIILSDGTKVWLNAASTLKYPSRFSGEKREVYLEGEGYFVVNIKTAGDRVSRVPFIVKTPKQEVLVLATSFNLSAYPTETSEKTTLVEGKVRIKNFAGASVSLVPNEQSISNGTQLTKAPVDINNELAWKNGEFSFEGKHLEQVMNELSRWYKFEVTYQGPIPDVEFFGGLYRSDQMNTVLRLLATNGITYKLDGRRLTIIGKEGQP